MGVHVKRWLALLAAGVAVAGGFEARSQVATDGYEFVLRPNGSTTIFENLSGANHAFSLQVRTGYLEVYCGDAFVNGIAGGNWDAFECDADVFLWTDETGASGNIAPKVRVGGRPTDRPLGE